MKLIVGLGNPGDKYKKTRHNLGFMALDAAAEHFGFEPFKKNAKLKGEVTEGKIGREKVIFLKPGTFMNLSGESVQPALHFYKIKPQDAIVIYDEIAIELGKVRIRSEGSAGGHNGIKSLIQHIGQNFIRVRLGIKPENPIKGDLADYVLGNLGASEKPSIKDTLQKIPAILETLLEEGVEKTMSLYN
jgi:PTH1 family peptidyl-tRNA hydrolase